MYIHNRQRPHVPIAGGAAGQDRDKNRGHEKLRLEVQPDEIANPLLCAHRIWIRDAMSEKALHLDTVGARALEILVHKIRRSCKQSSF